MLRKNATEIERTAPYFASKLRERGWILKILCQRLLGAFDPLHSQSSVTFAEKFLSKFDECERGYFKNLRAEPKVAGESLHRGSKHFFRTPPHARIERLLPRRAQTSFPAQKPSRLAIQNRFVAPSAPSPYIETDLNNNLKMWLGCCRSISCVGLGELAPSLEAGILWSMETATINYKIGNEKLIRVLDAASAKLRALLTRQGRAHGALRVSVIGGGCSGLQYKMDLVDGPANRDILVESNRVRVVIDPKSALFVSGSELDFSDDLQKGGFKVSNPNAVAHCSCGESFSA